MRKLVAAVYSLKRLDNSQVGQELDVVQADVLKEICNHTDDSAELNAILKYLKLEDCEDSVEFRKLLIEDDEQMDMEEHKTNDEALNPLIAVAGRLSNQKFLAEMLLQFSEKVAENADVRGLSLGASDNDSL